MIKLFYESHTSHKRVYMSHPMNLELYKNIPVTESMQMSVAQLSDKSVTLKAPLPANINHHQTAFGGSIYSLAVLSCWVLVHHTVRSLNHEVDYIVIQNGNMEYLSPVTDDFFATCKWEDSLNTFLKTLEKKKRARLSLNSEVLCKQKICAKFSGRFVVGLK